MFAANDVNSVLALIGEYEKSPKDLTSEEVQMFLSQSLGIRPCDRSLRRVIRGLGIKKNPGGYYSFADVTLITGWFKRRDRYASYKEYLQCEGDEIYKRASAYQF